MGRLRSLLIPGVDKQLLVRDATKVMPDLARRRFITGGGQPRRADAADRLRCIDSFSAEEMLKQISKFNDGVQAAIFNPNALAPTFRKARLQNRSRSTPITRSTTLPRSTARKWKFEVRGLVDNKRSWTLEELYKLPQVKQVTRHICVEGWSAIGSWTGAPLRDFLKTGSAPTRGEVLLVPVRRFRRLQLAARHGHALHPQTQMTFKFGDEILPRAYGYPMKIRVPTKLGFKNPKYVVSMEVTNDYQGRLLGRPGYNSFSGS